MVRKIHTYCLLALACTSIASAAEKTNEAAVPRAGAAAREVAALPTTQPALAGAIEDSAIASIDDDIRFVPTTRPGQPLAQHPPAPTTQNTDTGKPIHEWQRLTDDWFGMRPALEEKGITFQASLASYFGSSLTGGAINNRIGSAYLLNANFTFDTEKLFNLKGGTFFINFRQQEGLTHSMDGSFKETSHLYIERRTQISEVWYEQKLLNDKLRIKAGKIDANTEFDVVGNGGEFLNSYAGSSAAIVGFPTDPDPAFGADLFVYPTENFYAGAGAYDGSLEQGIETGKLGPSPLFDWHSQFLIGEIGAKWTLPGKREGRLGVGVWHHTGPVDEFGGGKRGGATGPYLTLDQTAWRKHPEVENDKPGIDLFVLSGEADEAVNEVHWQVGGGAKWTGPLPGRDDDILGLGCNYHRFSNTSGAGFTESDEFTIEAFYKVRLSPWFSVQPDFQYIHNPGGDRSLDDALVATIQILVDF